MVFDLLCGTFVLPEGRLVGGVGRSRYRDGEALCLPKSFWGQIVAPVLQNPILSSPFDALTASPTRRRKIFGK